eukprot:1182398-Prorocentrum_minimum.AAC.7
MHLAVLAVGYAVDAATSLGGSLGRPLPLSPSLLRGGGGGSVLRQRREVLPAGAGGPWIQPVRVVLTPHLAPPPQRRHRRGGSRRSGSGLRRRRAAGATTPGGGLGLLPGVVDQALLR